MFSRQPPPRLGTSVFLCMLKAEIDPDELFIMPLVKLHNSYVPKNHWALKSGYFEDLYTPVIQVQTPRLMILRVLSQEPLMV